MRVMILNLNYNGKSKQTISCATCTNQSQIREALKFYRNSYPDMVLYNPVSEVLTGGIYGYVRNNHVCVVGE